MIHQISNSIAGENYNTFIYEPYIRWPSHFHQNPELVLCLSGSCTLGVEGKNYTLTEGEYALILAGQIHSYETDEYAKVWVGVFSPEYFGIFNRLIRHHYPDTPVFVPDATCDAHIRQLLFAADISPLQLSAAIMLATDVFFRQVNFSETRKDNITMRIRAYVEANFLSPISLATMAKELGYEYHYLSRLFRKCMGMSFSEYVALFRYQRALELLNEDKSITLVAAESGFGSLRAFHLTFSRLAGCSPTEYKSSNSHFNKTKK